MRTAGMIDVELRLTLPEVSESTLERLRDAVGCGNSAAIVVPGPWGDVTVPERQALLIACIPTTLARLECAEPAYEVALTFKVAAAPEANPEFDFTLAIGDDFDTVLTIGRERFDVYPDDCVIHLPVDGDE